MFLYSFITGCDIDFLHPSGKPVTFTLISFPVFLARALLFFSSPHPGKFSYLHPLPPSSSCQQFLCYFSSLKQTIKPLFLHPCLLSKFYIFYSCFLLPLLNFCFIFLFVLFFFSCFSSLLKVQLLIIVERLKRKRLFKCKF